MAIGVIDFAVPVGVFPFGLAKSFRQSETFFSRSNLYPDGRGQRALDSTAGFPRRVWELAVDLSIADMTTLRAFYVAHDGPEIPFKFYDVAESFPLFHVDLTGASLDGQYIGRFDGPFEQAVRVGQRGAASLRIIEVV